MRTETQLASRNHSGKEGPRSVQDVDFIVAENIKARRMELKLTQEELADAIGVTFQQVQKYEKGVNRVSASRLVQLAKTLMITDLNFFFKEPGTKAVLSADEQTLLVKLEKLVKEYQ